MSKFHFHVPINTVSFGQFSTALLKESFKKEEFPCIFVQGEKVDLATQKLSEPFVNWLKIGIEKAYSSYNRKDPIFRIWHLNGALSSFSKSQYLFSFYELDSPTLQEVNIAKNQEKLFFSSQYSCDVFSNYGVKAKYIPLGFDSDNFSIVENPHEDLDKITFNMVGKLEKRKHHFKMLKAWSKKFGDDPKYVLNCAIYNPFLDEKRQIGMINSVLGKKYSNINFLPFMEKNETYNRFLNQGNIVLGMSGGEGWGLPEFHSVAMGKHAVIMNAHAYKGWATEGNAVLVSPNGKISSEDGVFFHRGQPFNQGNIFDFSEDDFIGACEEAIKRVESDKVNKEGLKLQERTYAHVYEDICKNIQ